MDKPRLRLVPPNLPPRMVALVEELAAVAVEAQYPLQAAVQYVRTRIAEVAVDAAHGSRVEAQSLLHTDQTTLAYALLRAPEGHATNPTVEDRPGHLACPVCVHRVSVPAPSGEAPWLFGVQGS